MSVNVKNFVDINIVPHISAQSVGTRDTAVLITYQQKTGDTANKLFSSLQEVKNFCGTDVGLSTIRDYATTFFDNGGVKLFVIQGVSAANLESRVSWLDQFPQYICVTYAGETDQVAYSALLNVARNRASSESVYGINQKLIIAQSSTVISDKVKNFIVKYNNNTIAAHMAIAAYLTRINVYKKNTVYDYMFTVEKVNAEDVNDETYSQIIAANMNVDIRLANQIRNCGGNCTDGDDIVNAFVRIVMQQTVTNAVLLTLSEKLKNQSGLNKIYSTITNELEYYKECGYLTTDKIWSDEDLYIEYNNQNYLIIEKGTPIQNGYFVKVLPFISLSESDKLQRNTPPIYIIVAEQYGIRKITINGEAI